MRKAPGNGAAIAGFTAVETLVSLAIIAVLAAICTAGILGSRAAKRLDTITDGLVFTLEQARSDALAGKAGSNYGVAFATSSYTYFVGTTYSPSASTNKVSQLPTGWLLSTTTANGATYVIFSRLTGAPQTMATVTVQSAASAATYRKVVVGLQGDVSVIR